MDVLLQKFDYKYMAYEQELLRLELHALLPNAVLEQRGRQFALHNVALENIAVLDRLTYIAAYCVEGTWHHTKQYKLEQDKNKNLKKQNTRYASHGIHEYKGKFNPQIVHALLNILGVKDGNTILDPFCGSGTTLVESAIWGFSAHGIDINPLAAQLSVLKIKVLALDCVQAAKDLDAAVKYLSGKFDASGFTYAKNPRNDYLLNWLPQEMFWLLERLIQFTDTIDETTALLFKISASNLIRDYSLQEPLDLRIRRRSSPMPETPFVEAWAKMIARQLDCISHAQQHIGRLQINSIAELNDIRVKASSGQLFDAAITSPPYATALPYIDTQRISLVWLGLCRPKDIMELESSLIGSREFYHTQKELLHDKMVHNEAALPDGVISLIQRLQSDLSVEDGFRKKAVPLLLYRYFSDMKKMFHNVRSMLKPGGKYALVVGNNKTTIGGQLNVIDTPALLVQIALTSGWRVVKVLPLQTYQRYGLNAKNAITRETLIILEKVAE